MTMFIKIFQSLSFVRWVDQCDENAHDKNRHLGRFQVGQNWAMQGGSYLENEAVNESTSQMVQDWYNEVSQCRRTYHKYSILKNFNTVKFRYT